MKTFNLRLLATFIAAGFIANTSAADSLVTFTSGTAAKAEEVNANFTYLESKIDAVSSASGVTAAVDCSTDSGALITLLDNARYAGPLSITLTGTCDGPLGIYKDDVTITGGAIAGQLNSDGDLEALVISGRTNIKLVDTAITQGYTIISRESYVRFENVSLPATTLVDSAYGEYEPNIDVRASSLRIESGSLDNLAMQAQFGSYVRISSGVTGSANMIELGSNASLIAKATSLSINGALGLYHGASFVANDLTMGGFTYIGNSSSMEVTSLSSNDIVRINEGSSFMVDGVEGTDVFSALAMECHGSSIYVSGNSTLTGTNDEAGGNSMELHHGCGGEFNGTVTAAGDISYSPRIDVTYLDSTGGYHYYGE